MKPSSPNSPSKAQRLPTFNNPNGFCPRCGVHTTFTPTTPDKLRTESALPVRFKKPAPSAGDRPLEALAMVSSLACAYCTESVVVVEEQGPTERGHVSWRGIHWWPLPSAYVSPDVPPLIAEAFAEAIRASQADCPRAAAAMARRTLEAVAFDKGETTGRLVDRLSALASKGVLQPSLAEWAKEVRLLGNTSAHFDPMDSVSAEDTEQLLDFLRELLKYLYELPADLARRRANQAGAAP